MWSITIQMMKKNMRMLVPAGIAIMIGAAFIAATLLFGNAMNFSIREQTTAQFANANYVVTTADDLTETQMQRSYDNMVGDYQLNKVNDIAGVEGTRPEAQIPISLKFGDKSSSTVAIPTSADRSLIPVQLDAGSFPSGDNEIAIPSGVAKVLGAKVGDHITVNSPAMKASASNQGPQDANLPYDENDGSRTVTVSGFTADPKNAFGFYGGAAVASDALMAVFYADPNFAHVPARMLYLQINPAQAKQALAQIQQIMPDYVTVQDRNTVADAQVASMTGETNVMQSFILAFGVIALLVAALVIANTFQVLVAQRRRTLALLRTIGARKAQLYRSVLVEAALLGLISSIIGLLFGIGIMALAGTIGTIPGTGLRLGVHMSWPVIVVPIAFSVIITVLASLNSARTATAVSPLEALRPLELTPQRNMRRGRAVFGILLLVAGIGLAVAAVMMQQQALDKGSSIDSLPLGVAVLACALLFVGIVLTAIFWMPMLMRGIGNLIAKIGPSANLANANIQKNPRRIAATGSALLIGVTLVATIATGAATLRATMGKTLDTRYSVDVVASADAISANTTRKIEAIQGVEHVINAPVATAQFEDTSAMLVGVPSLSTLQQVMNVPLNATSLNDNQVIMPQYNAQTGKEMTYGKSAVFTDVNALSHTVTLSPERVDYRRITDMVGAVGFVNNTLFTQSTLMQQTSMMLIKVDPNASNLSQVLDDIQSALSENSNVYLSGPVAQRAQWESMINIMMTLLVGLLLVAIIIAIIGVANTLSLSVIERTRESATLRAIGMTRSQLRRSLAIEALMIALVSSIVGIIAGTLFGWLGGYMVMSGIGDMVYPIAWNYDAIILAVAAAAALLASVAPARRAVRTSPVEALAEN